MGIVLFAIIGAKIQAGAGYWVCFGVYCAIRTVKAFVEALKDV